MPIYTFFPCKPDGSSASFEAFELTDDAAAMARAQVILAQHTSGAFVEVMRDEQLVAVVRRTQAPA